MLLFQKRFHAGLVDGRITLTFRRWDRPRVKVGGRYRCHPIGVLEVDAVQMTTLGSVTEQEAALAGFDSREELTQFLAALGPVADDTPLVRIQLHHGGDGDRVPLALEADLSTEAATALFARLRKLDGKAPWTLQTLRLIRRRPKVAASRLAKSFGRETLPFKVDVRKLKKLGLTQSFEVGYGLSPRGEAFLAQVPALSRAAARAGSASPTGAPPRRRGTPARGPGSRAGGAPGAGRAKPKGRAGAASRGRR